MAPTTLKKCPDWHKINKIKLISFFSQNLPIIKCVFHTIKAMPHGSEKSPEKNRNEIRHSLCMPHGRVKIVANYEENDT